MNKPKIGKKYRITSLLWNDGNYWLSDMLGAEFIIQEFIIGKIRGKYTKPSARFPGVALISEQWEDMHNTVQLCESDEVKSILERYE